jgi:hypothetical protein
MLLVMATAATIWLRNRDILSDTYDYSSLITAAGKVEAGLKPYVDFRSTMQSAGYLLSRGVELIAGRNYLGLTWGGLALSLGGAIALATLLWRRCGPVQAATLTGAVTLAGFAPHVIIFYNPLGILCLAIVVFGLAHNFPSTAWRGWSMGLVAAALFVAGTNKINFQALTVGLAGLSVLRAAVAGKWSGRAILGWWSGILICGVAAPLGFELAWTGATPREWWFNVVELAEARVGFVSLVLDPQSYLAPTYTLHHHVLFKPLHTVGLGVLLVTALIAWRHIGRQIERPSRALARKVVLGLCTVAAGIGGVLLTITNIEIITVTSLGVFIGAIGVAIGFDIIDRKAVRVLLTGSALLWMIVGGYAAWAGGRVLYGRASTDRSTFVRLVSPPPSLAYMQGVRLDANLHESLLLTARELEQLRNERGNLSRVLFGPTLEWLERAYPEAIMRGMPVWYDLGTSLRKSDGPWLRAHFAEKDIDRVLLHPSWESWPEDFLAWLQTEFRTVPLGKVVKLYERRDTVPQKIAPTTFSAQNPLALLDRTGSQIHVRMTRGPADTPPAFQPSPWGEFFGRSGSWTWMWPQAVRTVEGTLVATGSTSLAEETALAWRVIADPDGAKTVLWSGQQALGPNKSEVRVPFRIEPNGQPVSFEIEAPDGITAGWRDLRILHVGDNPAQPAPPGLILTTPAEELNLPNGNPVWWRRPESSSPGTDSGAWQSTPFETWMPDAGLSGPWRATLEIEPTTEAGGTTPIIMLLWCKSGRLEIMNQFAPPVTEGEFTVQGGLPERGGMIGIIVRPIEPGKPLNAKLRITRWPE